ncbi:TonB family protein [Caulobacter segnis]|uniref:energy transducer TonB family protein n=1 Tax=Caulobacter segnis TaxID=88688 RepID=UPI00285DC6F4|nr:TonB family protein [Caulobacter segnis]MDR6623873.1 TonB family protein [Caulobacter segnis]
MTPISLLAAGRPIGLRQWRLQALLSKGGAFVSSCGIVAAQLALVTFEAPTPPRAPPPDMVVSLVPADWARLEPQPAPVVKIKVQPYRRPVSQSAASRVSARTERGGESSVAERAPTVVEPSRILPAELTAAPPSPPQMAAGAKSPGEDDALRRYQDLIWRMIMARRPPMSHLRGGVGIAFHLMPGGAPCDIRITRGSGDPMLDRLAMATVQRAGPFPKPPTGVSPTTAFEIWFQFGQRDDVAKACDSCVGHTARQEAR